MRLDIEEQTVVSIRQQHTVFFLITQQGDSHTMDIIAEIASDILIGICWLHRIDGSYQTCPLIDRITVDNDILHDGA